MPTESAPAKPVDVTVCPGPITPEHAAAGWYVDDETGLKRRLSTTGEPHVDQIVVDAGEGPRIYVSPGVFTADGNPPEPPPA